MRDQYQVALKIVASSFSIAEAHMLIRNAVSPVQYGLGNPLATG
jgi:hypothetical protein